jgi:hypothetical protein
MKKRITTLIVICTALFIFPFTAQAARLDTHSGMMVSGFNYLGAYYNNLNSPIGHGICGGAGNFNGVGDWFNFVSVPNNYYLTYPITIPNGNGNTTETHWFSKGSFEPNADGGIGSFGWSLNQGAWYNYLPTSITYNDDHPENAPQIYVSNNAGFYVGGGTNNNNILWCANGTPVMYADTIPNGGRCYYNYNDVVDADWHWARANQGWSTAGLNQGYNAVYFAGTDASANYTTSSFQFYYDTVAPTANGSDLKNVTDTGFDIYLYNVGDATSGVNRVQVPTWSNNSQYDLRGDWPTNPFCSATNIGGGTWVYHVDKANFNGDMTGFCSDWYLYDNAGNVCGIGSYHGVNLLNRNATVTSDIPATMELGQATTFHVTATNTGTYPWTAATNFRLGEVYRSTTIPGIPDRLYLPAGTTIGAGQSYTWTLTVTPTVLGVNNLDWNMLQEGVVWFGSNCVKTVNVVDTKPPTATYNPNSATWTNQNVSVTVTMADNIGGSGVHAYQYRTSSNNGATWGAWSGIVYNGNPFIVTLSGQGTNLIQTSVTDWAGNLSQPVSGQYLIDKTLPTVTYSPNSANYEQSVSVTIFPADTGSGVKQWRYRTNIGGIFGAWTLYYTSTSPQIVSFNTYSDAYIQTEVDDNAGNVSTINSGGYHKNVTANISGTLHISDTYDDNTDVTGAVDISFMISDTAVNLIPSSGVMVRVIVGGTTVLDQAILCPANNHSWVPFKFHTPTLSQGTSQSLGVTIQLNYTNALPETNTADNVITQYTTVTGAEFTNPPFTQYQETSPSGFENLSPSNNLTMQNYNWSEWRYTNSSLVLQNFFVNITGSALITPDTRATSSTFNSSTGLWTMRSGYGFSNNTVINFSTNYDNPNLMTMPQRIRVYYPEFNYDMNNNLSELELISNTGTSQNYTATYAFKQNPQSVTLQRLHFTPMWFPNGTYIAQEQLLDLWTPYGQLTMSGNMQLNISGSLYDDWYPTTN